MKRFLFYITIMFLHTLGAQDSPKPQEDVWLTVMVHGTVMPYFTFADLLKLRYREVESTMLTRVSKIYRSYPYFYLCQPIQGLGLIPIDISDKSLSTASQVFAKTLETFDHKCYNNRHHNRYYTFGWSGLLNEFAREQAAGKLYDALTQEVERIEKETGQHAKVRILAYSHGGGVCFELPHYHSPGNKLHVDELALFGTPIQESSYTGVNSPLFEKIYNFYSLGDRIQKLDHITGNDTDRTFDTSRDLPGGLRQVRIRFSRRGHAYDQGTEYAEKTKKRIYPGHIEMWSFGWAPNWYRKQFPIQPFPVAALTPFYIDTVEKLGKTKELSLEVAPVCGQALVASYEADGSKNLDTMPAMTRSDFHWLQKHTNAYSPPNFKAKYQKLLHKVVRQARAQSTYEHPHSEKLRKMSSKSGKPKKKKHSKFS